MSRNIFRTVPFAGRAMAIILAASAALPLQAYADVIGVDARNGFDSSARFGTGSDFDDFRAAILDLGHEIIPLTSFTAADLSGLDAVITHMPYTSTQTYTAEEIDALHNFVLNGGGHLLHADGGGLSDSFVANVNDLAAPYGVTFRVEPSNGAGLIVNDFEPHPVTDGVAAFGVDFQRAIDTIADPAIDLTTSGGDENVLAVVEAFEGGGNVVLLSDTNCWNDADTGADFGLNSLDNRVAFENMIAFILGSSGQRLQIAVSGNCPGTTTFDIVGATPGTNIALVYGFGTGPTTIPSGFPCAGTMLDVGNPNLDNQIISADANGEAVFSTFVPAIACGSVFVQALDLTTCATSNVVQP